LRHDARSEAFPTAGPGLLRASTAWSRASGSSLRSDHIPGEAEFDDDAQRGRKIQMKAEKIREMSVDELRSKEQELQKQLFQLRFQKSIGQLDSAGKIRDTRRDIARVKTVIKQRDIERARTQGAEAKR
jgi:large subunit ribosomal protein L29